MIHTIYSLALVLFVGQYTIEQPTIDTHWNKDEKHPYCPGEYKTLVLDYIENFINNPDQNEKYYFQRLQQGLFYRSRYAATCLLAPMDTLPEFSLYFSCHTPTLSFRTLDLLKWSPLHLQAPVTKWHVILPEQVSKYVYNTYHLHGINTDVKPSKMYQWTDIFCDNSPAHDKNLQTALQYINNITRKREFFKEILLYWHIDEPGWKILDIATEKQYLDLLVSDTQLGFSCYNKIYSWSYVLYHQAEISPLHKCAYFYLYWKYQKYYQRNPSAPWPLSM